MYLCIANNYILIAVLHILGQKMLLVALYCKFNTIATSFISMFIIMD